MSQTHQTGAEIAMDKTQVTAWREIPCAAFLLHAPGGNRDGSQERQERLRRNNSSYKEVKYDENNQQK